MKNFTLNFKNLLIVVQNCKLILLFITVFSFHAEARCLSDKMAITVESHCIWLNVTGAGGAYSQTVYGYRTDATEGYDAGIDAAYGNDGSIAITSLMDNLRYAIQMEGIPFSVDDMVPLCFSATNFGTYTFLLDHVDGLFLNDYQPIYLHDILTNTYTNLKTGNYIFDCNAGTYNNRFELTYSVPHSPPTPPGDDLLISNHFTTASLEIYRENTSIIIKSGNTNLQGIAMYSINGQLLYKNNAVHANTVIIQNQNIYQQTIIIIVISEDGKTAVKKCLFF